MVYRVQPVATRVATTNHPGGTTVESVLFLVSSHVGPVHGYVPVRRVEFFNVRRPSPLAIDTCYHRQMHIRMTGELYTASVPFAPRPATQNTQVNLSESGGPGAQTAPGGPRVPS